MTFTAGRESEIQVQAPGSSKAHTIKGTWLPVEILDSIDGREIEVNITYTEPVSRTSIGEKGERAAGR